jgi:hypothetical protein
LEHAQQIEIKKHAKNEGKEACKRENNVAIGLTMIGLWLLIMIVMDISLKNSINKKLGGLS